MNSSEEERLTTAYHEAGHAVMGCILGRHPASISLVPDGRGAAGATHFEKDIPECVRRYFDQSEEKQKYVEIRVLIALAGSVANDLQAPGRTHDLGDETDYRHANEIVSDSVSWEDHEPYVKRMVRRATELLKAHWSKVNALAAALMQRERLTRQEVIALVTIGDA